MPRTCIGQAQKTDTTGFKIELEKLLLKYGLKNKGYIINVTSTNQKGGQTAFSITNNYYGDTLTDANNFSWEIVEENQSRVLLAFPKKGIWSSPYVVTDSIKSKRFFYNPGIGVTSFIHDISATFEGKTYNLNGSGQSGAASKMFPLKIYLSPDDKEQFYIFGDLQFAEKHYLYYKGKVVWFPMQDVTK